MGTCFKNFKRTLYKNLILKEEEPNWDDEPYATQKDFWEAFKHYRLSDEYLEVSRKNKQNSEKAMNPHRLGSRGYAGKINKFQAELDGLEERGVEPKTASWEPGSLSFCMVRGVHHGLDGGITSENPSMSNLVTKISEINEEVMQGTRTSSRENDVLTQALGNKEHGGRTRGADIVPWKLAFEEDSATYRSRSRGKAAIEAECERALKEMEANFEK
jgi:hypothetical protein